MIAMASTAAFSPDAARPLDFGESRDDRRDSGDPLGAPLLGRLLRAFVADVLGHDARRGLAIFDIEQLRGLDQ
jgi:hypothetical protein